MAIDIKFDLIGNPEPPTIILATRNGNKLGQLVVDEESITLSDKLNDASEISFTLNKYVDGKIINLWDKVVNFKLIYCKEWDCWFEITVELDEETETVKTVFGKQLGQAELSQIMLYDIEINTEDDIARDDYKISILYDPENSQASILTRLLDKAPHYSIKYVAPTIRNIQRSFSFDDISIYDAFQEIAEEIGCLFVFHSDSGDFKSSIITEESQALYEVLVDEQDKIEDWGLSEFGSAFKKNSSNFSQHKFGNVDMDNRIVIAWSNGLKDTFSNALASWDYDPEIGSIDTVFGGSSRFGESVLETGVEIAYTPIVITNGEANFVDIDTVYSYIEELVNEATFNGVFNKDSILALDKEGRYVNGIFVQNIIAATDLGLNYDNNGNWAETVGRLMHFSGEYGAISLAQKDIIKYAENNDITFEEFIYAHQYGKSQAIRRAISVYDLEQNCQNPECKHRGTFTNVCPKCGGKNKDGEVVYGIDYGYGEDTAIFVTADELANGGIQLTTDTDAVKNCFKLEAGDDLMTATIRNRNPNGTDYIWYFSKEMKEDMPSELVEKIEKYDKLYSYYYTDTDTIPEGLDSSDIKIEKPLVLDTDLVSSYNALVEKYKTYYNTTSICLNCDYEAIFAGDCPQCGSGSVLFGDNLQSVPATITGFAALMEAYYNTIDLGWYLKSGLMPSITMAKTNAEEQALLLELSLPPLIAITNLDIVSLATANSAVLAMAKAVVNSSYKVSINSSVLVNNEWSGNFIITNYSDEEDTYTTNTISRTMTDWDETYIKQKIEKLLSKEDNNDLSITGLFEKEYDEFCEELKKYALNPLISFHDACQACIDILIEQGVGTKDTWSDDDEGSEANLYEKLYLPYYNKLQAIESEMTLRENEIKIILGDSETNSDGLQTNIEKYKNQIQEVLNFENYIGEDLWLQFCAYRREDKYSNDNYISDGLNNAELFKRALEFYEVAENEIFKSSELQHSISSTLDNLLAIPKFKPLVNSFKVGNWIRIQIDDKIYKLRLLEYEIDYGNFEEISVEFSDVSKVKNGITDVESILSQASSMASSYDSVQRQANQGNEARSTIRQWLTEGLDASLVQIQNNTNEDIIIDNNGLLGRSYSDITAKYSDEQIRLTHNIIAYTDDNWQSVKMAIGKHKYNYYDEGVKQFVDTVGYGVSADFVTAGIVSGSQIIGGNIYSDNYSITESTGSYINLRDGTFSFGGGILRFEGGKLIISSSTADTNITELNEEWLKTTSVYAQNLNVNAAKVTGTLEAATINAGNVNAGVLQGMTIMGGQLFIGDGNNTYAQIDKNGVLSCEGAYISGDIYGSNIYGSTIYASYNNDDSFATMAEDGFYVYVDGHTNPKISLYSHTDPDPTQSFISLILGSGSSNQGYEEDLNRFYVNKYGTYSELYYRSMSNKECGFTFNDDGTIDVIGTLNGAGVAVFG